MRYVLANEEEQLYLGRQGENGAETVLFDISGWDELPSGGEFVLMCERSGDTIAYPCVITVEGDIIHWVITSTEVYKKGVGRVQLMYTVDDVVVKSAIFITKILESLDGGEPPPDPVPSWIAELLQYGSEMETSQHIAQHYAELAHISEQNASESAAEAAQSAVEAASYLGSPLVASTASAMTDHSRVYVYVGDETGYVYGNWYYYNGTAWASGGVYNSIADDVATNAEIETALYT